MLYVFMLGMLIAGFGCTPMFTLAFVYLDENSSRGNSAVLTGCARIFTTKIHFKVFEFSLTAVASQTNKVTKYSPEHHFDMTLSCAGIYQGTAVLGVAVGFLLSGIFLDIYGDFYREDE